MRVVLADTVVEIDGWTRDMDSLGEFSLKIRKTPDEIKEEKRRVADSGSTRRVLPYRSERHTCISFDQDDPGKAFFLPGLWPRISGYLKARNVEYELVDRRNPKIRPEMDLSVLKGETLRAKQDVALALIGIADCGIIMTPTAFGKSYLIALMCKAYPTLNIVVTTASTQVVGTLCEYLRKQLPGQVGMIMGGRDTSPGKRVVVSTLKSLPNIPPDKVDLVFVDECHSIGYNDAGKALMKFCFARRFGFSASPVRNDGSGRMMEAILGPVILKMDYQEAVDAGSVTPMKYLMLRCGTCPSVAKSPTVPEFMLKRFSYWCNDGRNRLVQRFVYDLKKVYGGQILIMVSTLEHAIRLHMMLPWFKVAYYGNVDMSEMRRKFPAARYPGLDLDQYKSTAKQLEITRRAFAKGTLRYCISTKVFRQGVNFTHLACLIRADGDTSAIEGIQIPGRLSRLDEGKDCAYLVDVYDSFSDWARRRSDSRISLYDKQKWQRIEYQEMLNDIGKRTEGDGPEPAPGLPGE